MLKNLGEIAVRVFLASLVIILVNIVGVQFNYHLSMNLFNIGVVAGFGIPGLVAAILLKFFIG